MIEINCNKIFNDIKNKNEELEKFIKELNIKESKSKQIKFCGKIKKNKLIITEIFDFEGEIYKIINKSDIEESYNIQDDFLALIEDYVYSDWGVKYALLDNSKKYFEVVVDNEYKKIDLRLRQKHLKN